MEREVKKQIIKMQKKGFEFETTEEAIGIPLYVFKKGEQRHYCSYSIVEITLV